MTTMYNSELNLLTRLFAQILHSFTKIMCHGLHHSKLIRHYSNLSCEYLVEKINAAIARMKTRL